MEDTNVEAATVLVLGARLGGSHVIESLISVGITIRGVYDLDANAPGIALARKRGVPVYVGNTGEINRLFQICSDDDQRDFHVFLPTRDPRFLRFVSGVEAQWRAKGVKNFTMHRLGEDFEDYERAHDLLALTS